MGYLKAVGKPVKVKKMWKNTREEVMWFDRRSPWRRSPLWLLVRVSMQLVFSRSTAKSTFKGDLYKTFMVFFLSRLLDLADYHPVSCDLRLAMKAKLERRLVKLCPSMEEPVFEFVNKSIQNTHSKLTTKWSTIRDQFATHYDFLCLRNLKFDADIFHSIPPLEKYIELIAERQSINKSSTFQPVNSIRKYHSDELPTQIQSISFLPQVHKAYNLKAFEAWVASNLSRWLESHKGDPATCSQLGLLIQNYHSVAFPLYSNNAEALSTMLLTIIELWIACDESATSICELLEDYDPGIPHGLFESLVLPFRSQMERLSRADEYLNRRRKRAKPSMPSIFKTSGHRDCFSVRYFEQSPEHQSLLDKIQGAAMKAKLAKVDELRNLKDQYDAFMKSYDDSECEFYEVVVDAFNDFREQEHLPTCKKCRYKSKAASLSIQIYEWPLPSDILEARSTVFELQVPLSFGSWRDTTIFFIIDVLKASYKSTEIPHAKYPMEEYKGLRDFFTPFSITQRQRVHLLSPNKPHEVTHRREKPVGISTESDICLDNGLRYYYYDRFNDCLVDTFDVQDEIPRRCTYSLPAKSSFLQRFIFRPSSAPSGPSPNAVIAAQSNCPHGMSLDEYKALGAIGLGYRLQWYNILPQLQVPSVDFKKVETCLVILQCIQQAGPSGSGHILRESHEILDDKIFACNLLDALQEALQRVKESWESS